MKKSFLLVAASLAVISCSKREFGSNEGGTADNQVRFDAATSGVAVKVGVDANGHSTFAADDIIGVYVVNDTKKLGDIPLVSGPGLADGVFPALSNLQFLDKKYKVTTVDAYVDASNPAKAHFVPQTATLDEIYYQTGDLGWNYYAYYPTSDIALSTGSPFRSMPSSATMATAANFVKTDATLSFMNQTAIAGTEGGVDAYPGPIMFSYYSTADKAAKAGNPKPPTNLSFKYGNAKITLNVEMKGSVGTPADIKNIIMCGDVAGSGLTAGLTFDLTKANAKGAASGVYDVIAPAASGVELTGLPLNTTTKLPMATGATPTNAYHFGWKIDLAQSNKALGAAWNDPGDGSKGKATDDSTLFHTTGYLIPAGNAVATPAGTLKNIVIKFYVGAGNSAEVFTAKLDQTLGGTISLLPDGISPTKNFLPKIEPGKEYKFKILLDKQGVVFTGTIEDWVVIDNSEVIPAA